MKFYLEQRLNADFDTIQQILISPLYFQNLNELDPGGKSELVKKIITDDFIDLIVHYHFVGSLPSAAKAIIDPSKLSWTEETRIDKKTHKGTFSIIPDNYKDRLDCYGTTKLEVISENETLRVLEGDLKVHVFLLASAAEAGIVSGIKKHNEIEEKVINDLIKNN